VVWESDGAETVVSTQRLNRVGASGGAVDSADNKGVEGPFVAAAQPIIAEDDGDSSDSSDEDEEVKESKEEANAPGSDPLCPHGMAWTVHSAAAGPIRDVRLFFPQPPARTTLRWERINTLQLGLTDASNLSRESRSPLDYFFLSFPVDAVWPIVGRTCDAKPWEQSGFGWISFSVRKFFKIIGFIYLMSLCELPTRRQYFQTPPPFDSKSPFPGAWPDWGRRFGMGETEFSFPLGSMSWSAKRPGDAWHAVRDFLDAFNKRRRDVVEPSAKLTVDESMSANRTNRTLSNHYIGGLPHQTKIARKPEGVGCEIRILIDASSLILLGLELQEGKEPMKNKKYYDGPGSSGTASLLRLAEPYFGTHRTVYADSAFGSVRSALALAERGLFFIGMVKTASRRFPKKYFKDKVNVSRGTSEYLQAQYTLPLYAVAWWDKTMKTLVTSCANSEAAPPHEKQRYRINEATGKTDAFVVRRETTATPHEYFANAQKVDVHNHRRQGVLALERNLQTHDWSTRLISTVLGMILVDAYGMYRLDTDETGGLMDFRAFTQAVGMGLVENLGDPGTRLARTRTYSEAFPDASLSPSRRSQAHFLRVLRDHPTMNRSQKKGNRFCLRCIVCHQKTSFYCVGCSSDTKAVAVCNARAGRQDEAQCLSKHIDECSSQ